MTYGGDSKACRIFDDRVYRRATLLTGAAAWCQIQSAASEYEMEEEEFHQLQLQQWSKFYSCCVQYYQVKRGAGQAGRAVLPSDHGGYWRSWRRLTSRRIYRSRLFSLFTF